MFQAEQTQGQVTHEMREFATEGIAMFEKLLNMADTPIAGRLARDGVEFYSNLVSVLGDGFEIEFQFHASRIFGQAKLEAGPKRKGRFQKREHFDRFMELCFDEQMDYFDSKYF